MTWVCVVMAGCGAIEKIENARELVGVVQDANAARVRVLGDPLTGTKGLPGTNFDAMPLQGEATFLGTAALVLTDNDRPRDGMRLVGRSIVTVDFEADAITGRMDQFISADDVTSIAKASGGLTLRNGDIGRLRPNTFDVDYGGTLRVDGVAYVFNGDMVGQFRGTRPNPANGQSVVRAISALDVDGTAQAGDQNYTVRTVLIAEN